MLKAGGRGANPEHKQNRYFISFRELINPYQYLKFNHQDRFVRRV